MHSKRPWWPSLPPTNGLARRLAALQNRLRRGLSFQCKFKVAVSFAQVCSVLGPVYGVSLHPDFQPSLSWLDITEWDLIDLTYPSTCLGSMRTRMLLGALWPYAAVAALSFFFGAVSLTPSCWGKLARPPTQRPAHRDSLEVSQSGSAVGARSLLLRVRSLLFKKQPPVERARAVEQSPSLMTRRLSGHLYSNLYLLVFVLYLVLPLVSNAIFEARLCESFGYDDTSGLRISFLLADLSLRCNSGPTWSSQTTSLDSYFWTLFTLWMILVPSCFLVLLLKVRSERRALRTSQIAWSTRFLWHDYRDEFLFWEIVDVWRKIFLTAIVLFIDTAQGSNRVLRLVVAIMVSTVYLAALAVVRPHRRSDDFALAFLSNVLLICCFSSGVVLRLCEDKANSQQLCSSLVGLSDSRSASLFVVILSLAMLATAALVVLATAASALTAPTMRLVRSGAGSKLPNLMLPTGRHFHLFVSHSWCSGQDQAHTIVRRLQQLLPDLRIWLDVDYLDDVGKLEDAVADAAVMLVFLSVGYFESLNCRRELYAALGSNRPFIPVREADPAKGGASIAALMAECRENCVEAAPPAYSCYRGPEEMLARVFEKTPIVWVRVNAFQLESLKAIALRMLLHSPYYASRTAELAAGVTVPGEVVPVALSGPVTLLHCRDNEDAFELSEEIKSAASARQGRGLAANADAVTIRDAEEALEGARAAPLDGHVVLLLYLNDKTFLDAGGAVARLVQAAMDRRIAIALVHEQEPARGGVPFRSLVQHTPQVLRQPPYTLFDTVAVPLYPSEEHRRVSLRLVLCGMGAVPCDAGLFRRRWQHLRRRIAVARLVRAARRTGVAAPTPPPANVPA